MDWTKLLKLKIYNHFRFLVGLSLLIFLILFLLVFVNVIALGKDINVESVFEITKGLFSTKSKYWTPESIAIAVFILTASFIVISVRWLFSFCKRYLIYLTLPKTWDFNKDFQFECFNDLEIQGKVNRYIKGTDKGFGITSSAAGVLIKNKYWRDCKIEFDFDFKGLKESVEVNWVRNKGGITEQVYHQPKNNYIGLLFRAQDLDNYFMIQIGIKQMITGRQGKKPIYAPREKVLVKPLVKADGKWEVYNDEEYGLKNIKVSGDNHVICELRGNVMSIAVGTAVKNFEWILPSKFRANYIEEDREKYHDKGEITFGDSTNIPFRNTFGMVGFRAYDKERVIIKNLKVTKLNS